MSRNTSGAITEIIGPFVSEAAMRGQRPPVRIIDQESRGWIVVARRGDTLLLDEFGDLWWCRVAGPGVVRSFRRCWPEEAESSWDEIAKALMPQEPSVLR